MPSKISFIETERDNTYFFSSTETYMARYNFMVVCNPVAGRDAEFNEWYTNQHVPDVLKVPGFVGAQRFEVAGESALSGRYVTVYEMETDDPAQTLAELQKRGGKPEMPVSDALDVASVSAALLSPITPRMTS